MGDSLTVLVLGGGPDREREVSLKSAASVAAGLRGAGHRVIEADVGPDDLAALDQRFDVVFPVLHGRWGEGGTLQRILETRGLKFVGSGSRAAWVAMDKCASKQVAERVGVATPAYQMLGPTTEAALEAPVVIKALTEGSSYGVWICRTAAEVADARRQLHASFAFGLAERFIPGREVTVGILEGEPLPPIWIRPATEYYDHEAKYFRNDTRYEFDLDLPAEVVEELKRSAATVFKAIGCRHLGRVDFIVDEQRRPWFLEINTLPGFTGHSLLPKAAGRAGYDMPRLCDRLVRLALEG